MLDEFDALQDTLEHVRERTAWIRAHLTQVADELAIPTNEIEQWAIHPRVVTDEPLASGVRDWGIEIVSFDDLLGFVNEGVLA